MGFYFVAHYMGPEVLGIVGFAGGLVGLFSFLVDPGLNTTHIKYVSEGKDLGKCNGTFFMIKSVLILFTVIFIISGMQIYKHILHRGFDNPVYETVIYITIVGAIAGYIFNALKTTFSSLLLTARQELPEYLGLISAPLKIGAALRGMGAVALAITNTIGLIVACGTSLYLFRHIPVSWPSREYRRDYISFAAPLALVPISRTISVNIDKVILQLFTGVLQVGYLYSAQRIANLVGFFPTSISIILFPLLSERHSKGDISGMHSLLDKALLQLLLFIMPVVVIIAIFSEEVLLLIAGEKFLPAAPVLVILSIWVLVSGVNQLFQNIVVASGYNTFWGKVGVMIAVLATTGNILLVPDSIYAITLPGLGAVGAALSFLFSAFIGTLVLGIFINVNLGYRPGKRIIFVLVAGSALTVMLLFVKNAMVFDNVYDYLAIILLGVGIYFLFAYLLGVISRDDLAIYRRIINPIAMRDYISSEIGNRKNLERTHKGKQIES